MDPFFVVITTIVLVVIFDMCFIAAVDNDVELYAINVSPIEIFSVVTLSLRRFYKSPCNDRWQ